MPTDNEGSTIPHTKILVVDDEPANLRLVQAQLKHEPYNVVTATNGFECLEIAGSDDPPELIVLDVMMPGMDGFETCSQLKSNPDTAMIPVIMVTALKEVTDRVEGLKSGADEFISRPLNKEMMIVRIRALLGLRWAQKQVENDRQKFSAILEQSSDAVIVVSPDEYITIFNKAAEALFDISKADVINQPVSDFLAFDELDDLLVKGESVPSVRMRMQGRILSAGSTYISDVVGHVILLKDITALLEEEEKKRLALEETLSRYISPRLLKHFSASPGDLFEETIEEAVVLFADLRRSSNMILTLGPSNSVTVLNQFFSEMTKIVHEYDGIIFDLIGDELEVGFNVPIKQSDAANRALMTARAMNQRFDVLRGEWFQTYGIDLGLGIGIDRGDVVVGNIGSKVRMNLAMVGEAVHTAHRLVDLAVDGDVMVSSNVMNSAEFDPPLTSAYKLIGAMPIKGIRSNENPLDVYKAVVKRANLTPVSV